MPADIPLANNTFILRHHKYIPISRLVLSYDCRTRHHNTLGTMSPPTDQKASVDLKRQVSTDQYVGRGVHSLEAARLEQLGYAQELPREFSMWSMMALCMCLMATWEALSAVLGSAIVNGGAPCLFYN